MLSWMGGLPETIQMSVLQSVQYRTNTRLLMCAGLCTISHEYSATYVCRTLLKKSKSDVALAETAGPKSRAAPKKGKGKNKNGRPAVASKTKSKRSK